jgi:steroid 5-alpha reductase family enzyme
VRAYPDNKGEVMDTGLWRYTRHPNYFGDAVVWWSLAILTLHHAVGLVGLASAAAMTLNLIRGTGAKLLESTIGNRRPGYVDYVKRTSGFISLSPKKHVRT